MRCIRNLIKTTSTGAGATCSNAATTPANNHVDDVAAAAAAAVVVAATAAAVAVVAAVEGLSGYCAFALSFAPAFVCAPS